MIPTIIGTIIIGVIFFAIIGKGIYNRRHHKGGCGSCGGCGGCCGCHSGANTPQN